MADCGCSVTYGKIHERVIAWNEPVIAYCPTHANAEVYKDELHKIAEPCECDCRCCKITTLRAKESLAKVQQKGDLQ